MKFNDEFLKKAFPEYISEKRRPIMAPEKMVNDGIAKMGTFSSPIPDLNIGDCKKPLGKLFPSWWAKKRIKAWEAFEISFTEGFIVGAVYSIGIALTNVLIFFDKQTKEVISNQVFTTFKKDAIKDTLVNGGYNYIKANRMEIGITNNFDKGYCQIKAVSEKTKKNVYMSVDATLKSVSNPSVCVMPLGENRPLYSQKELFKAEGTIIIGDNKYVLDETALAIIDDHKAYYPYPMHYDWVTGFGITEEGIIGFNLTENQVINPEDYNENYLWVKGELHPLPPITFSQINEKQWYICDKQGVVDINFYIENSFKIKVNALGLIKIDYTAPFGYIKGSIKDLDGNKHVVDNLFGMGEDKTYKI